MIFDMDGVLVHSMPLHTKAWEQYLRSLGVDVSDLEQRMHGKRNTELVWEFLGASVPEEVAVEHGAAKERLFRELMREDPSQDFTIPGVNQFLARYQDVPKAIGSNAEPQNIEFILERLGLRRYFPITVDGSMVERPKPFPDIYLKCAEKLGVNPANCIVFEDSPTGADAGLAAGMRVVGVETTPTVFHGVHLQVNDFLDLRLEQWLRNQRPV